MNNDTCMFNMEYLVVLWTFKTPKVYNTNGKLLRIDWFLLLCVFGHQSPIENLLIIIERKTFSLLATRSNLVIIIILFLTDFVHAISLKRLDGFSWNFPERFVIKGTRSVFFLFSKFTSGHELRPIFRFLDVILSTRV